MVVRGEGRRCETPDVLYKGCNLTLLNNTDNSSRGKLKQQGSLSPSLSAFVMDEIATKSLSLSMYIYITVYEMMKLQGFLRSGFRLSSARKKQNSFQGGPLVLKYTKTNPPSHYKSGMSANQRKT